MTRINAGISPKDLCDQHLLAEWRELPRIRHLSWKYSLHPDRLSRHKNFKLGAGHMLFFADKGLYLAERHRCISDEMIDRSMHPSPALLITPSAFPMIMRHNWKPTARDRQIVMERIRDRLTNMKNPRWTKRKRPTWSMS